MVLMYVVVVLLTALLTCNSFSNDMNKHMKFTSLRTTSNIILMNSNNNKVMTYGADNFGDVMGGCETNMIVGGSFTPLERIVITANGNLQRIMSAYYGAPVIVNIIKCDPIKDIKSYITDRRIDTNNNDDNLLCVYDREVSLLMNSQIFCIAKGMIEIYDKELIDAIEYKKIGLGQMFRYLGALPSFKLHAAGRKQDGSLWRDYSLYINGRINCHFVEEFTNNLFDLHT